MTEQPIKVLEVVFGFLGGFLTKFLLHFIDVHRYASPANTVDYLCIRSLRKLRAFALGYSFAPLYPRVDGFPVLGLLTNGVSLLQTKLGHREGYEARRIGLEAMPLDQHIESRHGEREPGVERRPHAVHDPLKMADHGQRGEHRLHEHAVLPLAALTQFQVAGIPLRGMEAGITQDDHA